MRRFFLTVILAVCPGFPVWALNGNAMQLNSGSTSGANALISNNGYAGNYITLAAPGDVTVTVNASGTAAGGVNPHLRLVIADSNADFDVTPSTFNNYSHTFQNLPAGTYFIRNEFNNDGGTGRDMSIASLNVSGATLLTATDTTSLNANALAAADTYINNFRRGPAKVALVGVAANTSIHAKLTRHAFNFGVNVPGSSAANIATYLGTPTPGSTAEGFQQFIASHYINTLVPSNYGKWSNTEPSQNAPTMDRIDTLINFANSHDMRVRMHALVWGDQNPTWVLNAPTAGQFGTGLLAQAMPGNGGNTTPYVAAVSNRIDYYVGNGSATDRTKSYIELDVHNEELHKIGTWWSLGADGEAKIFKEVMDTVAASGANTKLYVNEYNVLQNSPSSIRVPTPSDSGTPYPYNGVQVGSDPYANWYRQNIDDIQNAAVADPNIGVPVVSGVGSQYYVVSGHSANTMMKALENLAVTDLPMSLTEFGVQGTVTNQATAANYMEESMRMIFGNPNAETFMYWGFWGGATSNLQSGGTLVGTANSSGTPIDSAWKKADGSWNLTPAGVRYEWLFGINPDGTKGGVNATPWSTDVTLPVAADGTIDFTGFYGDYDITIGGHTYQLTLNKGDGQYSLVVAPGDYNADGIVDAADYTVWRDTLGSANDLRADGNGNEMIDQGDYDVWQSLFGTIYSLGSGSAATVPEPASISLLLINVAALLTRRPARMAGLYSRGILPR